MIFHSLAKTFDPRIQQTCSLTRARGRAHARTHSAVRMRSPRLPAAARSVAAAAVSVRRSEDLRVFPLAFSPAAAVVDASEPDRRARAARSERALKARAIPSPGVMRSDEAYTLKRSCSSSSSSSSPWWQMINSSSPVLSDPCRAPRRRRCSTTRSRTPFGEASDYCPISKTHQHRLVHICALKGRG